jgi:hypothetical protein
MWLGRGSVVMLAVLLCFFSSIRGEDDKKESKGTGKLTLLGTLQGEISAVKDGGWKIEVKYKDLVPYNTRATVSSTQGAAAYPRYRLPPQHVTNVKEKTQELELRLLESSKVRFIPFGKEGNKGKKGGEAAHQEEKAENKQEGKQEGKQEANPTKKSKDLPGKPGEPSQLAKGQLVNVTVAREEFPNFSRYVATVVLVVGEK